MQSPQREKRLRIGLTYSSVVDLPAHSTGHRKNLDEIYSAAATAGYEGMQGGSQELCRVHGLQLLGAGVISTPREIESFVAYWKKEGAAAATCIVGYGFECDSEMDAMAQQITEMAERYQLPVYIETHRASITQDAWRTTRLVERVPNVRLNGDFSHWFTGQEMAHGDFTLRLDRLAPVFDRVRFLHGRIGTRCCMQVDIGDGVGYPSVPYFRSLWTESMLGFLKAVDSGEDLWFCPELLGTEYQYAHMVRTASGQMVEQGDRWEQSSVLARIAKECFTEARDRHQRSTT